MSDPSSTDIFLVQRGSVQHQVPFSRLGTVADGDLLLVQRGAVQHRVSGADLKAYIVGTEPPPVGDLWTPADTQTLLWLDFADANSVTVSSGRISQVDDKSGAERHFTQGNAALQPTYGTLQQNGLNVLGLPAAGMELTGALIEPGAMVTICRVDGATFSGSNCPAVFGETGGTWNWHRGEWPNLIVSDMWANGPTRGAFNGGAWGPFATFYPQTPRLHVWDCSGATARWNSLSVGRGSGSPSWIGHYCEVIATPANLTDDLKARFEGYMMHKWGMEDQLPAGHPYRTAPPTKP